MKHKPIIVIGLILISLVVLLGYLVTRDRNNVNHYVQVDDCQIDKGSCQIALDQNSTINIDILPRGIPSTEQLTISVNVEGDKLDETSASFEAIEINTTTPQYRLYEQTENNFSGSGFLAFCSLSKQSWITHLIVKKGDETWKVSLPFEKQLN
ncbi:MAG: hypothetical protein Ctma_0393 [Catillopecten margaritatus gill symbiont]|uniref:YtkA-like domain-containing protein n=1 Tax=Catillopecten margaritatus gill symbiont TaxID=3083288 RepID=A0AAU6PG02_9GAMM